MRQEIHFLQSYFLITFFSFSMHYIPNNYAYIHCTPCIQLFSMTLHDRCLGFVHKYEAPFGILKTDKVSKCLPLERS